MLAAAWGAGDITQGEWVAARDGLDNQERKLQTALMSLPTPTAVMDLSTVVDDWDDLEHAEKRAVIAHMAESIVVNRGRGTDRIKIEWRR
jgi:hypothetical protein